MPERHAVEADNAPIFQDFLGEAPQLLQAIESALLTLAQGGPAREGVDAVMRSLHTLKGIFGFLGLDAMHSLCHKAEDALLRYQGSTAPLPHALLQWQLQALDAIRAQVDEIARGLDSGSFALIEASAEPSAPAAEAPEAVEDRFLRIRVEKMDALLELVGEMAICQAQVAEGLQTVGLPPALASELGRQGKISRELQESVLGLRLVPIEPLFLRASRVAHDISLKTGKTLSFESLGKDTELDKRTVEELAEPLMHLIRNAVDHGLESTEERLAAGKAPQGKLRLSASRDSGDLLLQLDDDGRGLDWARLAARGKALGLIAAGEEHDEERLSRLIFEPGFSTAETVTSISGRGVGLDAVRSRVQALKGEIQVKSVAGQGLSFILRLPLSLSLVEGILVRVGEGRYVLPANQIRSFAALDESQLHLSASGRPWLELGGQSLPLLELRQEFGLPGEPSGRQIALQVESLGRRAALVVDEVLGKQQVVAKGLGLMLQGAAGVQGGAILGDGRVSLILDLEALMKNPGV